MCAGHDAAVHRPVIARGSPADRTFLRGVAHGGLREVRDVTPPTQPGDRARPAGDRSASPIPRARSLPGGGASADLDAGMKGGQVCTTSAFRTAPVAPGAAGTLYHWWQEGTRSPITTRSRAGHVRQHHGDRRRRRGVWCVASQSIIVGNPDPADLASPFGIGGAEDHRARRRIAVDLRQRAASPRRRLRFRGVRLRDSRAAVPASSTAAGRARALLLDVGAIGSNARGVAAR